MDKMDAKVLRLQEDASSLMASKQREFRSNLQRLLDEELKTGGKFQRILSDLEPKDYIDTILRMMPYAYSKAPEEKPTQQNDDKPKKVMIRERLIQKS